MPEVFASTQIDASPAFARSIFLDFSTWPTWHKPAGIIFEKFGLNKASPLFGSEKSTEFDLAENNKVNIRIQDLLSKHGHESAISEKGFGWESCWHGIPGLFQKAYFYKFESSDEGGCKFTIGQKAAGILTYLMKDGPIKNKKVDAFFVDFKARCGQEQ